MFELVLGTIYSRVSISVTKTNDRARALALDLLDKFATAMAKLPAGTLTTTEMRAYIDREILTIPITQADIIQDDARAGTAAENTGENALQSPVSGPQSPVSNPQSPSPDLVNRNSAIVNQAQRSEDPYGANALASEADELLSWLIATLPEAELAALITESNQVVAALRLTTHIEDLSSRVPIGRATLAAWLNR